MNQNSNVFYKLLIIVFLLVSPFVCIYAQCDKLYNSAIELQKTKTVKSQKDAIAKFELAKECYSSAESKKLCDQGIAKSKRIISNLNSANNKNNEQEDNLKDEPVQVLKKDDQKKVDVRISLSSTNLIFKAKMEPQTVSVTCNKDDWYVKEVPDWIEVARNGDQLTISCLTNDSKEERQYKLVVCCADKRAELLIMQHKMALVKRLLVK